MSFAVVIQIRIQARTTCCMCFIYWRNQVTCLGLPDFAFVMSLDEFLYPAVSHRLVVELEDRADSGFVFWARVLDRWCWVLLTVLHQWAQVVWLAHFQVMWWISGCRYCQPDPSIGHFPYAFHLWFSSHRWSLPMSTILVGVAESL